MTYSAASSSDSSIVSVERRSNNTVVRITGKAAGTATVTVTVADGQGGSTTEPFSVTVKPSCDLSSIGNQTIFKGDSRTLSLSSACDGTYSASSSDSTKVTVSVNNSTDKLTITGVAVGTATLTVRVTKTRYTDDSVRFTVRVREKPSCDLSSIGNQTIIKDESEDANPIQRLRRDLQRQLVGHQQGDGVGQRQHRQADDHRGCGRDGDGDGEGGEVRI